MASEFDEEVTQDTQGHDSDAESNVSDYELGKEEQLISAVQKWPILFDQSNKKYRNAVHKQEIWIKVTADLNMDGKNKKYVTDTSYLLAVVKP